MEIKPLQKTNDYLKGIIKLLLSEHVVEGLDYRVGSIDGIRRLIKRLFNDDFLAYGAYEDEKMVGFVWGELIGDVWEPHTAFDRHVDTTAACKIIEDIVTDDPRIKIVKAYSPVSNRAARYLHLRLGMKRAGVRKGYYMKDFNKFEDCIIMQKEC